MMVFVLHPGKCRNMEVKQAGADLRPACQVLPGKESLVSFPRTTRRRKRDACTSKLQATNRHQNLNTATMLSGQQSNQHMNSLYTDRGKTLAYRAAMQMADLPGFAVLSNVLASVLGRVLRQSGVTFGASSGFNTSHRPVAKKSLDFFAYYLADLGRG